MDAVHIIFSFFIVNSSIYCISMSSVPWLEQISRQEILTSGCDRLNSNQHFVDIKALDHILVDHNHRFLYCYVPKVACTNWKRVLMVLTERSNVTNVVSIPASVAHADGSLLKLTDLKTKEAQYILQNYTSFLMVRHPFERLLSAFRNKLEDTQSSAKYFQARIGRHIIKNYRQNARPEDIERGDNVTFREFVRYLLAEGVTDDSANEHWRPVQQLCQPCAVNYTFIGKYERFGEDSDVLLEMIRAPKLLFPQTRSSHTSERLRFYFQQLPIEEIEQLYRLYEVDFQLFGYSLDNILGYDFG